MNEKIAAILLVDDEINILRALKRVLACEGYEIHCATKSDKAIKMIGSNRYDLIICDQKMPGLSGIDLLEYSSRVSPDTIRILITGYSDFKVMEDAINKCRIHYYFPKPWDNSILIEVIRKTLSDKQVKGKKDSILNNLLGYKSYIEGILNILDGSRNIFKEEEAPVEKTEEEYDKEEILTLKKDDSILFLKPSEIYYLASSEGKVTLVTVNSQYYSWDSLKAWEEKLKNNGFFRCHRSYIVNVAKIKKITSWFKDTYNLEFHDIGDTIYSSKSYIKPLKKFIQNQSGRRPGFTD